MKKIVVSLLSFCLIFALCATSAFAEGPDAGTETDLGTTMTFDYQLDPSYTVTIPSSVVLEKNGTPVVFEASNVENLGGKSISVTVAGTSAFRDQFVLEGKDEKGRLASMRFSITTENGDFLTTNAGAGVENLNGTQLASFADNGSQTLTFAPLIDNSSSTRPGVAYSGTITYGISLA